MENTEEIKEVKVSSVFDDITKVKTLNDLLKLNSLEIRKHLMAVSKVQSKEDLAKYWNVSKQFIDKFYKLYRVS